MDIGNTSMNTFLLIETSLILGEVAIFHNGKLIRRAFDENAVHTRMLIPNLDALLRELNIDFADIDAIFVNRGPGSHTGVRVGITTARMLAYETNKTLLGVSALEILALKAMQTLDSVEKYKILSRFDHAIPFIIPIVQTCVNARRTLKLKPAKM